MKRSATVFVGLSGGVDSSVAALRLKKQGYNVVGVFIKVWHPPFLQCNWEQERLDAMRVAAHLEIPFLTCDAASAYKKEVADYFISEYKAGRTPNPDIMCNQAVKFGAFLKFAKESGADFIATGHYVRRIESQKVELHRGVDTNKDQSYFLWSLTQAQLNYSLFPIGDTEKDQIRAEAKRNGIPVAQKQDSQGICFLGQVDIPEFLSHYIELTPGRVLDTSGQEIGIHKGALVYTLGQRHGFEIFSKTPETTPYYVVEKNVDANSITVDTTKPVVQPTDTIRIHSIVLRDEISQRGHYQAQFRYRQTPFSVALFQPDNDCLEVVSKSEITKPASGQSCVLYEGSKCIGGGIIQ